MTTATITGRPEGIAARLIIPSGDAVPVRSFEEDDGDVVLVPLVDVGEYAGSGLEPSLLEYASRRGMVRMRGEAVVDHAIVRFRAYGEAEVIQRREYVRVHTPQAVEIDGPSVLKGMTVDLSGGGMLISGVEDLEPQAIVPFTICLPDGEGDIAGTGRVVRCLQDGKRALTFERISESDRDRLIRFVFALMRSARAKTRGDWF